MTHATDITMTLTCIIELWNMDMFNSIHTEAVAFKHKFQQPLAMIQSGLKPVVIFGWVLS